MSKRSLLLLGLTGVIVGVIASEIGRSLFRARVENALRDPREKNPGRPLPQQTPVTADEEELWVAPLHEETSHLAH